MDVHLGRTVDFRRKGTKVIAKGTPVIIFGEPNFKTKPWKDLLKSSKANDYSEAQLNNEIKPF
jgi:hypothetical protein